MAALSDAYGGTNDITCNTSTNTWQVFDRANRDKPTTIIESGDVSSPEIATPGESLTVTGQLSGAIQYDGASAQGIVVECPPGTYYLLSDDTTLQNDLSGTTSRTHIEVCFLAGTRIATPEGSRPDETLAVGDLVITQAGALPVHFVSQTVHLPFMLALGDRLPVRISVVPWAPLGLSAISSFPVTMPS